MSHILTICIPTYNRSSYLVECIEGIGKSIRGFENEVEVLVSDNASTDDTRQVMAAHSADRPWLRYHRNDTNIGAEMNFYSAVRMADSDYCWIVGDDDVIAENAIPRIVEQIRNGADLIIVNYAIWSKNMQELKRPCYLSVAQDLHFSDPNSVMRTFGWKIGMISTAVFKKGIFLSTSASEYRKYAEYGFPHLYTLYKGMLGVKPIAIAYISQDLVRYRSNNSGNYDWYKYFVDGSSMILMELRGIGYSDEAVKEAKKGILTEYVVHDILVRKRDGTGTKGLYSRLRPHYGGYKSFWFKCLPALMIPDIIAGIAIRSVLSLRKALSH